MGRMHRSKTFITYEAFKCISNKYPAISVKIREHSKIHKKSNLKIFIFKRANIKLNKVHQSLDLRMVETNECPRQLLITVECHCEPILEEADFLSDQYTD